MRIDLTTRIGTTSNIYIDSGGGGDFLLDNLSVQPVYAYSFRTLSSDFDNQIIAGMTDANGFNFRWFTANELVDGTFDAWLGASPYALVTNLRNQAGNQDYDMQAPAIFLAPQYFSGGKSLEGTQRWMNTQIFDSTLYNDINVSKVWTFNDNNSQQGIGTSGENWATFHENYGGGDVLNVTLPFQAGGFYEMNFDTPPASGFGQKISFERRGVNLFATTINGYEKVFPFGMGAGLALGDPHLRYQPLLDVYDNSPFYEMIAWSEDIPQGDRDFVQSNQNTYYNAY